MAGESTDPPAADPPTAPPAPPAPQPSPQPSPQPANDTGKLLEGLGTLIAGLPEATAKAVREAMPAPPKPRAAPKTDSVNDPPVTHSAPPETTPGATGKPGWSFWAWFHHGNGRHRRA